MTLNEDEGFYDDWRATEVTYDYYSPLEAEIEAKLQQLENERNLQNDSE